MTEEMALALWKRYFDEIDDPYEACVFFVDSSSCFFCTEEQGKPHGKDCIYILAKELVGQQG